MIHSSGTSNVRLKPGCTGATFTRCRMSGAGFRLRTYGHNIDAINAAALTVQDSWLSDAPGTGVALSAGTVGALVQRNVISDMGMSGVALGWYADVDQCDTAANPTLSGCIDCVVRNNVIARTQGAGIIIVAALRPQVLHNTLWAVAMSQQNPLTLAPYQMYVSASRTPFVPCVNVTLLNNIVSRDALARAGTFLEIRTLADCCGNKPTSRGLSGWLYSGGNVYNDRRSVAGAVFKWGTGVMLENDGPGNGEVVAGKG